MYILSAFPQWIMKSCSGDLGMKDGTTFRQNQWQFNHGGSPIVEIIINDLQLTLDWMDTITTFVPCFLWFSFRTVVFMNYY